MKTSDAGIEFIKAHEGMILRVYADPIGLPTVGIGHLVRASDHLRIGDVISEERALALLRDDLGFAEFTVNLAVKVVLSQNQFDALVSFTFNVGSKNFRKSTLLKLINQSDFIAAAEEFPKWASAGGRRLPGLIRRRAEERALFLK